MSQKRFFPRKPSNFTQNIVINTVGDNCCPEDVFLTQASFNTQTRVLTLTRNDGGQVSVTIPGGAGQDVYVVKAEFNNVTRVLRLTRNDGATIDVTIPAGGGSSSLSIGNTFFVATNGDDFTAQPDRLDLPWQDPVAAMAAASAHAALTGNRVTVHVFAGVYEYYKNGPGVPNADVSIPVSQPHTWLLENNVSVNLETGVEIHYSNLDPGAAILLQGNNGSTRYNITGDGKIFLHDDTYILAGGVAKSYNIELNYLYGSIRTQDSPTVEEINLVVKDAISLNSQYINYPFIGPLNWPNQTPFYSIKAPRFEGGYFVWAYGPANIQVNRINGSLKLNTDEFCRFTGDGQKLVFKVDEAFVYGFSAGGMPTLEACFIRLDCDVDVCALFMDIDVKLYEGNVKPIECFGTSGSAASGKISFSNLLVIGYAGGGTGLYAQPMRFEQTFFSPLASDRKLYMSLNGHFNGYTYGIFNFYNCGDLRVDMNLSHFSDPDGTAAPGPPGSTSFPVADTAQSGGGAPGYPTMSGKLLSNANTSFSCIAPTFNVQFVHFITNLPALNVGVQSGVFDVVPSLY